jgi:hypothetical protein
MKEHTPGSYGKKFTITLKKDWFIQPNWFYGKYEEKETLSEFVKKAGKRKYGK